MCGRWRGAWARAGWRFWDLGNGAIMLQKLFNPKLLPNLSSSRVFLSAHFIFHNRGNFQVRTWVWRKFAAENRVNFQRGDWTGAKWSSQSRKTNFLTLPDLAFGFVHKRSGNEITFASLALVLTARYAICKGSCFHLDFSISFDRR